MNYDLLTKVYNNEIWLNAFIYPTTGKRVIRFETFNEENGLRDVVKEISVSTFRNWLNDFYKIHPRKPKMSVKEWVTIYNVVIPIRNFTKKK